ncbi:MAG: hypothetical protein NVV74_23850 [Magnetospirillum sp.]|nr:hypothetical protein [Magnetospirillum sp.]
MGFLRVTTAWRLACAMAVAWAMSPSAGSAATESDFQVKTTRDLVTLCDTPPNDPLHTAAVNFCQGFVVGAYQYHTLSVKAEGRPPLVCPPSPPPSRNESVARFVQWSKTHEAVLETSPVAGMFEFLAKAFPCHG